MAPDRVLELEMRRRIYEIVREYPGLHLRELARQADTSVALVEYHVPFLVDAGLATVQSTERFQRVFATQGKHRVLRRDDRKRLAVLREAIPLQVSLFLLNEGPVRHKQVVEGLHLGKSKATFHLQKLQQAGIVEKRPEGTFALVDPKGIQRLLLENRPTPDLREEFADLWVSFYEG